MRHTSGATFATSPRRLGPLALAPLVLAACAPARPTPSGDRPSLVVLLVVDQFPQELLDRYDDLYVGGLRRLLDEGFNFSNATHDHAGTETAPGHTTLSTGVYPTRHGIVGNNWAVRQGEQWRGMYAVGDAESPIVGHPDMSGRSPVNILRPGLGSWLLAQDGESRVVTVSRKDRSAIGLAAQARGEVYWLADDAAAFVTSEYYRSDYPDWVVDFNRDVMPEIYADTVWETIVPPEERARTRPDTSAYELDGVHTAFPHRPADTGGDEDEASLNLWRYEYTPYPDRAVVSFAITAIGELDLGRRRSVDFLGVSLSQTDLVGHRFGPGSREQLDNLLRLDGEIGRLLDFLDEEVGPGGWVLALSADHGVLEIPEELAARGVAAGRLTLEDRQELLGAIQRGMTGWDGQGPVEQSIKRSVSALPFVARAYTFAEIESATPPDSFAVLIAHSHSRERIVGISERWGVYTLFPENVLEWSSAPATHGTPYYYDRHVPMIFLGDGIHAGSSQERVATVDVAPTLAALAGVPVPGDLDGRSLEPILAR